MVKQNTFRILIWIIAILLATNLSMVFSFLYRNHQDKMQAGQTEESNTEMPAQQRTRFFREQLNLDQTQLDAFRELNRNYNWDARQISIDLQNLRIKMVTELGEIKTNQLALDSISNEIGELHAELKKKTIEYYLAMKKLCDEDQQEKLNTIFMSVLKTKEDVSIPENPGRRNRN